MWCRIHLPRRSARRGARAHSGRAAGAGTPARALQGAVRARGALQRDRGHPRRGAHRRRAAAVPCRRHRAAQCRGQSRGRGGDRAGADRRARAPRDRSHFGRARVQGRAGRARLRRDAERTLDARRDHRAAHRDRTGRASGERHAACPPARRVTAEALRDILATSRTVAVVGLSPTATRPSHGVARYLREAGYRIVPVNPGHSTVLGEKSYPTLTAASADHAIDVVDVFRRSEFVGPILDGVGAAVATVTGEPPLLVANAPDGPTWRPDLRTIPDVRPGQGSLGGIYTAVVSGVGPVLCVAWDMPFLTTELLRALLEEATEWDVFLPASDGRRGVEPLCAVYGPACGAAIERQLARGDLRAIGFHVDVKVGTLPLERVRAFGEPAMLFFNVNTPEDLEQAETLWRRRG